MTHQAKYSSVTTGAANFLVLGTGNCLRLKNVDGGGRVNFNANGAVKHANTLEADITNVATAITFSIPGGRGPWPEVGDYLVIDAEAMVVTSVSGTTVNVTRAQLGSTGVAHTAGARVYIISPPTAATLDGDTPQLAAAAGDVEHLFQNVEGAVIVSAIASATTKVNAVITEVYSS